MNKSQRLYYEFKQSQNATPREILLYRNVLLGKDSLEQKVETTLRYLFNENDLMNVIPRAYPLETHNLNLKVRVFDFAVTLLGVMEYMDQDDFDYYGSLNLNQRIEFHMDRILPILIEDKVC